jgi:hypothetical protein
VSGRGHLRATHREPQQQAKALEHRASELATQTDEQPERTNAADLDALRSALKDSAPRRTKAVLHNLIEMIRVDARDHIEPTFRVPAVRIDYGYMEPTGIEPVTSCLQRRPDGWRLVSVATRCRDLQGI